MHSAKKIITIKDWRQLIAPTGRIVFTNGCFDLLHPGHVDYLEKAKALGDHLVVGLNSDTSVARLKGPRRPINNEQSRSRVLAGLACVDTVIIFEDDTPWELINAIRPQILVKGGDWPVEQIVGRDIVEGIGGTVLSIPLLKGYSSTGIIERVCSLYLENH